MFDEYPDILNIRQVSDILGISTKTAYKLVREEIESFNIGRAIRVPKIKLLLYMNLSD